MSIEYLKSILETSRSVVCLLGRAPAVEHGSDFYRDEYSGEIELKYGYSTDEIFSSTFYQNRPKTFYKFYREEILKKRGEPDECNFALKRMEEDGRLLGIVTRGFLNLSRRAGCRNVIQLYGNIDENACPRCGKKYDADYILGHTPLPLCEACGAVIHPGVALKGEILDNLIMTQAADLVSRADTLLVVGCNLMSSLGSLVKYFNGRIVALINNEAHYSDHKADCICIGNISDIMKQVYPAEAGQQSCSVKFENKETGEKRMKKVKTRFAPSPTGRMHVGNLRTALYAYLIAKHEGGSFMLRIEDTDQERFMDGALDIIYHTLKETGLVHDEGPDKDGGFGPYVQSERNAMGLYLKYAKQLIDQGDAYYCFCDKERLESLKTMVAGKEIAVYDKHCLHLSKEEIEANLAAGKPYVIRMNMPTEGTTTFHDEIYGNITVENAELDDMILIKSDGYPTYNFANVIDDHLMGITHVVRGNEYLSSTPKYNRLYEAFGWEIPVYIHCPLINNEDGQKLSKRCGHSSYEDLVEQGFLTEAIVNFVALLGWSPAEEREIYTLPELVKAFDYRRISKSSAVFDMVKLKWMNSEYMKAMDDEKFYEMALPYIQKVITKDYDLRRIAGMVKTRISVFPEIGEMIDFFEEVPDYDVQMYVHKKSKSTIETSLAVLQEVLPLLETLEDYSNDGLFQVLSGYAGKKGYKINQVMWPVRVAASGRQTTPAGATEILAVIGREETVKRIRSAIEKINDSL
ncbi:glutamate--tRNA ligase [Lachnospiraceae bacterium OF09-33XD]|uniref:Glutamate--tRNA ligase n=2 Tax=Wansuia hejianensis TaxID=2763667 RepID=A0A7G9GEC3_9FIRM|nr:glutamate--tRNA ligase [Wansuia hejianensis]RHV92287.1 glutamate--tRNA ligase [Lachnospiraceae bacterium OF09-33XD]